MFNLVIELFVQSLITSLLLSLVISFVIIGAATGNAVVLFGSSFIGLILIVVLLLGALKALMGATNRLMGAMGQATGGNLNAAGQLTSLAASMTGGGLALAGGASMGQAAGVALSGTSAGQQAYYAASAFGRETPMGNLAAQIFEGASAGRVFSPVVGGALLPHWGQSEERSTPSRRVAEMDADGAPLPALSYAAVGTPIQSQASFDALYARTAMDQGVPPEQVHRVMQGESVPDVLADVREQASETRTSSDDLTAIAGIGAARQAQLNGLGITRYADLAQAQPETIQQLPRVTATQAQDWIRSAQTLAAPERIAAQVDAADDDDFAQVRRAIDADTPEADRYRHLTTGLRLPSAQTQQIVQQVMQTGQMGAAVGAAVRASLSQLRIKGGQAIKPNQIERAARALEEAAQQLAESQAREDGTLDAQVTAGRPAPQGEPS